MASYAIVDRIGRNDIHSNPYYDEFEWRGERERFD
jgi:hypothetical protein